MKLYQHLQPEERAVIMIEKAKGSSNTCIAKLLNRDRSTISRELIRQDQPKQYSAVDALSRYKQKRTACLKQKKLSEGTALFDKVHNMIRYRQWSPEQIANRLKVDFPDDPSMRVSHECIYSTIYAYPRNQLKKLFIAELRQSKSKRGVRRKGTLHSPLKIEPHQTIDQRPKSIETRQTPGHWEGDLIVGAMNRSSIGTLVERTTGYVVLCKMNSKCASDVRESFVRQMKKIDTFIRLSMTYDRASEMAEHPLMSKKLNIDIYFADPHSPWQRSSNENTNGLLRQYLPKGTDLSQYSQANLNDIAWLLNTRPRKRHQWRTPQELFDELTADHINSVALDY